MQLTRDLFAIAKFLFHFYCVTVHRYDASANILWNILYATFLQVRTQVLIG